MTRKEVDTVYTLQLASPRLSPYKKITCALKRWKR